MMFARRVTECELVSQVEGTAQILKYERRKEIKIIYDKVSRHEFVFYGISKPKSAKPKINFS